ncbi:MAG: ArsR family transcriptional regulator [Bacteroidales bacterium]|nr:ArsR family transcriptional regulator [Bacteroidales bacterium]
MLQTLITSKTRIKLMLRFFLNSSTTGYLNGLGTEFGDSTNAIRLELNRFEEAGLLEAHTLGPRKVFQANTKHPLFDDINRLVRKYTGLDAIVDSVVNQLGQPREVYLMGDLAQGLDSPDISLIIVGEHIDLDYLEKLVAKAQKVISRNIKYIVLTQNEFKSHHPHFDQEKLLPLWEQTD